MWVCSSCRRCHSQQGSPCTEAACLRTGSSVKTPSSNPEQHATAIKQPRSLQLLALPWQAGAHQSCAAAKVTNEWGWWESSQQSAQPFLTCCGLIGFRRYTVRFASWFALQTPFSAPEHCQGYLHGMKYVAADFERCRDHHCDPGYACTRVLERM